MYTLGDHLQNVSGRGARENLTQAGASQDQPLYNLTEYEGHAMQDQTQTTLPSSLQQSSEHERSLLSARGNRGETDEKPMKKDNEEKEDKPKKKEKCAGKGDGWECKGGLFSKAGGDVKSGSKCKIKCTDEHNFQPHQAEVECDDGKYADEPECEERVQCESTGGGWKCKGIAEDAKLNGGDKCIVQCAEPDYLVENEKVQCEVHGDEGHFVPEAGCREGKHCESKGGEDESGWECAGEDEGREDIKSGASCTIQCVNGTNLVPNVAATLCVDGKYKEEPACEAPPEVPKAAAPSLSIQVSLSLALLGALSNLAA